MTATTVLLPDLLLMYSEGHELRVLVPGKQMTICSWFRCTSVKDQGRLLPGRLECFLKGWDKCPVTRVALFLSCLDSVPPSEHAMNFLPEEVLFPCPQAACKCLPGRNLSQFRLKGPREKQSWAVLQVRNLWAAVCLPAQETEIVFSRTFSWAIGPMKQRGHPRPNLREHHVPQWLQ